MLKKAFAIAAVISAIGIAVLASQTGYSEKIGFTGYSVAIDYPYQDYLGASDILFDYPVDDFRVKEIAGRLDKGRSAEALIQDIEQSVRDYFEQNGRPFDSSETDGVDCDDYARLFVAIARASGMPARVAYNSSHMWAEVLIPFGEGYRWIAVDPANIYEK